MAVGGLDRDAQRIGYLLGLQTARQQRYHLGLALGEAGRTLDPRPLLARRLQHRGDRLGIEPFGAGLLADGLCRPLAWQRRSVRPRLDHRLVCIGGRKQPRTGRERSGPDTTVVARAVEPLVVGGRDWGEGGKERRPTQDALGVVGVQPHPLPLAGRERPLLLPNGHRDRDPTQVVDQGGASHYRDLALVEPAPLGRCARQLRDSGGVAGKERGDEVAEVAHRREGTIDRATFQDDARGRLTRERLVPYRQLVVDGEDVLRLLREASGDDRVEGAAGTLADDRGGELGPAQHALDVDVPSHVGDPHRQRDLFALGVGRALSVPALVDVGEQRSDGRRHPKSLDQHPSDLAAGDVHARHHERGPGNLACDLESADGQRRPRRHRAGHCGHHLPRLPEPHGHEVVLHRRRRVAEDPRPHMDVGGAADLLQQARVIALRGGLTVDVEALGKAHRDECAAQPVLEIESHTEIGCQRQSGDHLRRRDPPLPGRRYLGHSATVPQPARGSAERGAHALAERCEPLDGLVGVDEAQVA